MTRPFLTPIDMNGGEIRNVLAHILAVDPGSPAEGQYWYNSTDNVLRYFDGTSVIDVGGGGLAIDLAAGEIIYGDGSGNEVAGTPDDAGIVDKASNQTISGNKTHSGSLALNGAVTIAHHFNLAPASAGVSFTIGATTNFRVVYDGAGGHTATLPGSSSSDPRSVWIENRGTGDLTVTRSGTDTISVGATTGLTTITLKPGETAIMHTRAGGTWVANILNGVLDLQGKLDAKAPLASPAFTGNPTAPTPATADNDTSIATTAHVHAVVAALVDSAPGTLDTLNELAAALGDDPNFATTIANSLATKATKYTDAIGDGVNRVIAVSHNLNNRWVNVQVFEAATGNLVEPDITLTDANTVTIDFQTGPIPALDSYRVVVSG